MHAVLRRRFFMVIVSSCILFVGVVCYRLDTVMSCKSKHCLSDLNRKLWSRCKQFGVFFAALVEILAIPCYLTHNMYIVRPGSTIVNVVLNSIPKHFLFSHKYSMSNALRNLLRCISNNSALNYLATKSAIDRIVPIEKLWLILMYMIWALFIGVKD
jgi:hypothetical protein